MKHCIYCNAWIEEDDLFCTQCGKKQEMVKPSLNKPMIKNLITSAKSMEVLNEILEKYPDLEKDSELSTAFNLAKYKISHMPSNDHKKMPPQKMESHVSKGGSKELWTWIRAGNKDAILYENDANPSVGKEQFMNILDQKLRENGVPASLKKESVNWDLGKQVTEEYEVDIKDDSLENPFSLIVNFTKIGRFSFARENLFVTPPKLPPAPKEIPTYSGVIWIVFGVLLLIMGDMMGEFGTIAGLILCCVGGVMEFIKYSRKQAKQQWEKAWNDWMTEQVEYTFQQVVNGKLECIQAAVKKSLSEVCEELYPNALVQEDHSQIDQADLEAAIAKKKKSME